MDDSKQEQRKLMVAKVILAGEMRVGKTSIRRSYFGETFVKDHLSTLGADFAVKRIPIEDDSVLEFQIWDLAGQVSFQPVRKKFFVGSLAMFLIFDLTNKVSFELLHKWFAEFWESFDNRKDIPMILIGNKDDLTDQQVSDDEMAQFWTDIKEKYPDYTGNTFTLKTSAKTGANIKEAFELISRAIIDLFNQDKA